MTARTPQQRQRRAALADAAAGAQPALGGWLPPEGGDSVQEPAGVHWDAVRVPAYLGDRLLYRLRPSGAVIRDPYGHRMFWFIPPGASQGWEPIEGISTYGTACWVEVPPAHRMRGMGPYWVRHPAPDRLHTDPDRLHAVLTELIAVDPVPGAVRR